MTTLANSNGLSTLSRSLVTLLSLCALSMTSACANIEGDEFIADEEEWVEETSDALMVGPLSTALAVKGGPGGFAYNPNPVLCPAGYVATGFNLRTGHWVDNIQMQCTLLKDDGTFGDVTTTAAKGGSGGTPVSASCPQGQMLVGQIVGTNGADGVGGTYVGKLGGHCASISRVLAGNTANFGQLGPYGSQGTLSNAQCPAGMAVIGFQGRSGAWTDQVGFICGQILMPHVASYPVTLESGAVVSINSVKLNDQDVQAITVSPGASVKLAADYNITQWASCPGCIDQIMIGLAPQDPKGCIYNGVPSLSGTSGTGSVTFTAPTTPGVYAVRFRCSMEYSCNLNSWNTQYTPSEQQDIAYINVF